ncbi:MAG: hypothetical protein LBC41_10510 [Clostridiales bacterium]|jgi:hypothetical protein|nr:hypothetical protein [Clostridiales bacterium]MDR2751083.1 hypothetical protein [Clostridiales bacterium]
MKKTDLTGMKFGRLTVTSRLEKIPGKNYTRYRCRCECGKEVDVLGHNLRNGGVKSCGCYKKERVRIDATGMKYGILTAIRPTEQMVDRSVVWEWECDCGNHIFSALKFVRNGTHKSCGCVTKENKERSILHAKSFLTYIEDTSLEVAKGMAMYSNNTSGYTGVYKRGNEWEARIQFRKRGYFLGLFKNIEDAAAARKAAEERLHGAFLEWYETNKEAIDGTRRGARPQSVMDEDGQTSQA